MRRANTLAPFLIALFLTLIAATVARAARR